MGSCCETARGKGGLNAIKPEQYSFLNLQQLLGDFETQDDEFQNVIVFQELIEMIIHSK